MAIEIEFEKMLVTADDHTILVKATYNGYQFSSLTIRGNDDLEKVRDAITEYLDKNK